MKLLKYILSLTFIMSTAMSQIDRTKIPEAGPIPNFSLPEIQKAELANGLKIMLVQRAELPVIQMQFVFQTGASNDPSTVPGLANLTMKLLDAGTKNRNILQIADEFDFLGARFSASTSYDGSFISVLTLKKHLEKVLPMVTDIIQNCIFPEKEFNRIKNETLTSLLQQKDRPEIIVGKVFNNILYSNLHPYGRPIEGNEESLNKISIDDLKSFYDGNIRPNNATLIVVGDISLSELKKSLDKYFLGWKRKDLNSPRIENPTSSNNVGIFMVDKPNAPQSQIRVGMIGVSRNTPDFFALEVMNMILGGNFNSRINWKLREQKGYTYGARSSFTYRKFAGPFSAGGGFKSSVTDSCVYELISEIKKIKNEDVSAEELEFAKNGLIRSLPRSFETTGQIASQLTSLVLYNLPDNYFNMYIQNIEKVTIDDVRSVSEKYLHSDRMTIVIVGDVSKNKEALLKLNFGKFNLVDSEGKLLD